MRVFTAGVLIVSLFLSSCGSGGDCALTCKPTSSLFSTCPGTREGCKAKKERLGCSSFDFGEANRTCRVSGCPEDECGFSGLQLFKEDEFETDNSIFLSFLHLVWVCGSDINSFLKSIQSHLRLNISPCLIPVLSAISTISLRYPSQASNNLISSSWAGTCGKERGSGLAC